MVVGIGVLFDWSPNIRGKLTGAFNQSGSKPVARHRAVRCCLW